jgi:hypothetical protein
MSSEQDTLIRSYTILASLQKNVKDGEFPFGVEENFVKEYHNVLDKLSNAGIELLEFRIPESEFHSISSGGIRVTIPGQKSGEQAYSKEKYVNKDYFLMKCEAVLNYFEIITSPEPKTMGFRKPEEK